LERLRMLFAQCVRSVHTVPRFGTAAAARAQLAAFHLPPPPLRMWFINYTLKVGNFRKSLSLPHATYSPGTQCRHSPSVVSP